MIITDHALERCAERGCSLHEIKVVLQKGINTPAKEGRKAREFIFNFARNWNGKYYPHKIRK